MEQQVYRCSDCLNEYPLTSEYWYRNKAMKSGFNSICKKCKKARDKKDHKAKYVPKKLTEYAIYDGEVILGIGTAKELVGITGMKEQTIRLYATKKYKETLEDDSNSKIVVKIEYEEEELWA